MVKKVRRAALYLRVSTDDQTVENQRLALEATCEQRGWEVVQIYADNGISGAKGRDKRPGLDALLKDAVRGKFEVVLAWAMDRLGRSLLDLLTTLNELDAANVALVLHQQAIDTTTPAGRMFFQVTGAFAEFERAMIRSRVNAGLARARARGAKLGRPRVSGKIEAAIRARLASGEGMVKVAKTLSVGVSTVVRVQREMKQSADQGHERSEAPVAVAGGAMRGQHERTPLDCPKRGRRARHRRPPYRSNRGTTDPCGGRASSERPRRLAGRHRRSILLATKALGDVMAARRHSERRRSERSLSIWNAATAASHVVLVGASSRTINT